VFLVGGGIEQDIKKGLEPFLLSYCK
jgi:hypothetical protein